MFEIGDVVIHPTHGAGVIAGVKFLRSLGAGKRYYRISLVTELRTEVMVPVESAQKIGLRSPLPRARLPEVWRVLRADPQALPIKHEQRYDLLRAKLYGGNVLKVAEALRDMTRRKADKGHLTIEGKRLYDKSMMLLAGEVAMIENRDIQATEERIWQVLNQSMQPGQE